MSDFPAGLPLRQGEVPPAKEELFGLARDALTGSGVPAMWLLWVPGRIEFLGKHTDYAGGRSLVCPVDRGFALAVSPRTDRRLVIRDVVLQETATCVTDPGADEPARHWSAYPATVARRVARNFPGALGADLAFASDLPIAAGMSSSSALVVGSFLALALANRLWEHPAWPASLRSPEQLAGYLGTVENGQSFPGLPGDRGVGTFGGSEDHTAMLCGEVAALVQYSYAPVRFERAVPLPDAHTFVVASSGVVAEKTGAAMARYNALSRAVAALLELWRADTGRDDATLAAALRSSPGAPDYLRDLVAARVAAGAAGGFEAAALAGADLPPASALSARLEHFLLESEELVPAAGDALTSGDLPALARAVERSQEGAERLLGNQVPETSWLARHARELGAPAASAFGAGFGGSVWALVGRDPDVFADRWAADYARAFPRRADAARFFSTRAGSPAALIGV